MTRKQVFYLAEQYYKNFSYETAIKSNQEFKNLIAANKTIFVSKKNLATVKKSVQERSKELTDIINGPMSEEQKIEKSNAFTEQISKDLDKK